MLLSFPRSSCFVLLTITSVSLVIITNKLYNILLLTITSVYLVNNYYTKFYVPNEYYSETSTFKS